jgi:hypothetical protein
VQLIFISKQVSNMRKEFKVEWDSELRLMNDLKNTLLSHNLLIIRYYFFSLHLMVNHYKQLYYLN